VRDHGRHGLDLAADRSRIAGGFRSLAGESGRYVTGTTLVLDAGLLTR